MNRGSCTAAPSSERVQALAPFLAYDNDPYLVVRDDGSLVWMWDAYTTTDRFPYSQPQAAGINYIRNSVKVVIDAYDGGVTFYQMDSDDSIANTWGKVFDGLFTPGDQMPDDLRRHMRYPEDMFSIQAGVLSTYHMTDPQIFYNKEDVWEIPMEIYGNARRRSPVVPYYEILALPGETEPEFALLQPFAPLSKKNLAALLVARQDGDNYGQAHGDRLPQGQAGLRTRPGGGPHHQRPGDLVATHAVGPGRQRGDPRQSAGGPHQPIGDVLRAGLPAGRAEPHPRVDPSDRRLRRRGGHGADPERRADQDLRRVHRWWNHDHGTGRDDHHDAAQPDHDARPPRPSTTTTTTGGTPTTLPSDARR